MTPVIKIAGETAVPYYLWAIPVLFAVIAIIVIVSTKKSVDKKNKEREEYEKRIREELNEE